MCLFKWAYCSNNLSRYWLKALEFPKKWHILFECFIQGSLLTGWIEVYHIDSLPDNKNMDSIMKRIYGIYWMALKDFCLKKNMIPKCPHKTCLMQQAWSSSKYCTLLHHIPWKQGSWGHHGINLGPTGPRWTPCWPHELCYLSPSDKAALETAIICLYM